MVGMENETESLCEARDILLKSETKLPKGNEPHLYNKVDESNFTLNMGRKKKDEDDDDDFDEEEDENDFDEEENEDDTFEDEPSDEDELYEEDFDFDDEEDLLDDDEDVPYY